MTLKRAWRLLLFASWVTFVAGDARNETPADEDVTDAIRSIREQVNALLDHRQQDYNALEESLKRAIEKNTELFVLKNEVKQLRKEVNSLRGGNENGNEARNERLRVRWLGSAVTELQGEVAQVLRTRNASEELAERSRMRGELNLLKGDVAAVGRGIRNLGGRIAKIEAVLGTIRVDIAAVKERFSLLSRTCADIASQLSAVQIEVKAPRCESPPIDPANPTVGRIEKAERAYTAAPSSLGRSTGERDRKSTISAVYGATVGRHRLARRHGYSRRGEEYRVRVEERLKNLERKLFLIAQGRTSLEKRMSYESREWPASLSKRVKSLEKAQNELIRRVSNVTDTVIWTRKMGESLSSRLVGSVRALEEAVDTNSSWTKQELLRLGVNAARKAAELSLTREELSNLRRAVQALSVSASKLQERSDKHQEAINRLTITDSNKTIVTISDFGRLFSSAPAAKPSWNVLQLDDRYLAANSLPVNCEQQSANEPGDGPKLLELGQPLQRAPTLLYCRDGWMVVARRINGALDFDRSWNDYSLGFGSLVSEYWIGNEMLHKLTRDNCTRLRIDLLDTYGERWRAEYQWFTVGSDETGYRLRIDGYVGNATDALSYQNGMAFSARDRDMDASTAHCAANYHGGWWFSHCQHSNLNGKYSLGLTWYRSDTSQWLSIASWEMSVRKSSVCNETR
ncbi:protein scabrous [Andrena cerasifolii]|uniref:protein scabrous n=1 Tax=Andrena cerasifolii TaxID=2819439 RepID=UPI004037E7BC